VKPFVLFIVGPTACGKSRIAIEVARKIDGEIISADSMLVYRGMDIGTAKPSAAERQLVPHHLIDILTQDQPFSVFEYRRLAVQKITEIIARGKTPLVVGGTGLYIRALRQGLVKTPAPDIDIRNQLEAEVISNGLDSLYLRLKLQDPLRAADIKATDKRRIIRALEILAKPNEQGGHREECERSLDELGYSPLIVGVMKDRETLYRDIEVRVDEMFEKGLVNEVQRMDDDKLSQTASQAVGYKEIISYLRGTISLSEARDLVKKNSRHLAKRQLTWFRKEIKVHWFEVPEDEMIQVTATRIIAWFEERRK
jgi:tRNA dimethylallyltransferase